MFVTTVVIVVWSTVVVVGCSVQPLMKLVGVSHAGPDLPDKKSFTGRVGKFVDMLLLRKLYSEEHRLSRVIRSRSMSAADTRIDLEKVNVQRVLHEARRGRDHEGVSSFGEEQAHFIVPVMNLEVFEDCERLHLHVDPSLRLSEFRSYKLEPEPALTVLGSLSKPPLTSERREGVVTATPLQRTYTFAAKEVVEEDIEDIE
jgi:hypothetical protein